MSQLGKYELIAEIARGGMGIVYLAVARGMGGFSKLLVIKELKPEFCEDPVFLEMFLEEARLSARLTHPNIVQTNEVGSENGRYFMVMEFLDGVSLSRILRKKADAFSLPLRLEVLIETLQALHYAHRLKDFDDTPLGVVHRDVSPQNVFLTFDGQVKLVDFGVAKSVDSNVDTRAGVLKGKPTYMAPEQVRGEASPQSDIFAVGVMLWETIAGTRLWGKRSDVETLTALLRDEIPSIEEAAPDGPPELLRICNKAMARAPSDRYATAADMAKDLSGYLRATAGMDAVDASTELGPTVSALFEKERVAVQSQIRTLKSASPSSEKLPTLRLTQESYSTVSASGPRSAVSVSGTPSGTALPLLVPPSEPPPAATTKRAPAKVIAVAALALLSAIALIAVSLSRGSGANAELGAANDAGRAVSADQPPSPPATAITEVAPAATAGGVATAAAANGGPGPRAAMADTGAEHAPIATTAAPVGNGAATGARPTYVPRARPPVAATAAVPAPDATPANPSAPAATAKARINVLDDGPRVHLVDDPPAPTR